MLHYRCTRCRISEVLNYGDACNWCVTMMRAESRSLDTRQRAALTALDIQRSEMLEAVERRADVARLYREQRRRQEEEDLRRLEDVGRGIGHIFAALFK